MHRKGRSPKRLEPFVFYKMTKRDEVQFGASSKRFRLVADCERRRRKAERLAGRMAVWKSTSTPSDDERERTISTQVGAGRRARVRSLAYEADEADVKNYLDTSPTSSSP